MKSKQLFITVFALILGISSVVFGQKTELKKFEFMKGEYKARGIDGFVSADFDKKGEKFSWEYKSKNRKSVGVITYDKKSNSYRLTETIDDSDTTNYKGLQTTEGFYFFELNAPNGIIKSDGKEILLRPLDGGLVRMIRFEDLPNKVGCKAAFTTEYYPSNFTDEQKAEQVRKAIGKLDFLVGTFDHTDGGGQVAGRFEDDGKKYIWAFKGGSNTSDAIITYNFEDDRYTLVETIGVGNSKTTMKYIGDIDKSGNELTLISTDGDEITKIILNKRPNDTVRMRRYSGDRETYNGYYKKMK